VRREGVANRYQWPTWTYRFWSLRFVRDLLIGWLFAETPGRADGIWVPRIAAVAGWPMRLDDFWPDESISCTGVPVADTGGVLVPCCFVERSAGPQAGFSLLIATCEPVEAGQVP
jgi:hypothetical protein